MSATVLRRVDPAANMARFYRLDVQPSLFGWSAVYEWGRIGQPGQVRLDLFETEAEAQAAVVLRMNKKLKRGYSGE